MSVRDARTAPFIWASVAALDHLRLMWGMGEGGAGVRESVGRSVYYALCELANDDRVRTTLHADSGKFKTSRARICRRAGVSDKPVDNALKELVRIGLVLVDRAESEGGDRPGKASFYTLLEPPETYGATPHVEGEGRTELLRTSSGATPHVDANGAEPLRTSLHIEKKNNRKKEESIVDSPSAREAWEEAKKLLGKQIPEATFNGLVAPLEVAGERRGKLVLIDSSEQGGGSWIRDRLVPLAMDVVRGFDGIEVLDERQLEDEDECVVIEDGRAPNRRVFDEWVESTGKNPKRTKFNDDRKKVIDRALGPWDFSEEELTAAVWGWRWSPHHRGDNETGEIWNDLELLLRSTKNIEKFRDLEFENRGKPATGKAAGPLPAPANRQAAVEVWAKTRALLVAVLPDSTFRLWIEPFEAAGERDGKLVLIDASDDDQGERVRWTERRYSALIKSALADAGGQYSGVEFVAADQLESRTA